MDLLTERRSLFGIPRVDPRTGKKYNGQFALNEDYLAMLVGQALPGIIIASIAFLLLLVMVLLIVMLVMTKIAGICFERCNNFLKPKPFTSKQLRTAQFIMIGFGVSGLIGCIIVFSQGFSISHGMETLTNTFMDSTSKLKNQTDAILSALNVSKSKDDLAVITEFVKDLNEDVAKIVDKVGSKRTELDAYMQQAQGFVESVSILLFIFAFCVVAVSLIQNVKLTLIFGALLSLSMILSWLVWGCISLVGVVLDDMCWSMDNWNVNKTHASITNDVIPCLDPKDAIYSMNVMRYEIYDTITTMNHEKLVSRDRDFCAEFYPVSEKEVCDEEDDKYRVNNPFGTTVCNAREGGYLGPGKSFRKPYERRAPVKCETDTSPSRSVRGRRRRSLLQRQDMFEPLESNYDFQLAIQNCPTYGATCVSSVYGSIENWDVSAITDMEYAFRYKYYFAADISNWDVSSVTTMKGMFTSCRSFNADLSVWDISSVTDTSSMFNGASKFNRDLSTWDVSFITDMSYMFYNAYNFNGDVSTWDTSSLKNMNYMFNAARLFNRDIGTWNTKKVSSMQRTFFGAYIFNSY